MSDKKKTVWTLGVDHGEHDNVIAIFETKEEGFEFVESKGLKLVKGRQKNAYSTVVKMDGFSYKGLFYYYYIKGMDREHYLHLRERPLGKQFISYYDE